MKTRAEELKEAFAEREQTLPGLKDYLVEKYQNEQIFNLLVELSNRGATLRATADEQHMYVSPKEILTPELSEQIKLHKAAIVRAMLDIEYVKTGVIQCPRHVFEFAQEHWGGNE
jgi:hypothetical protein